MAIQDPTHSIRHLAQEGQGLLDQHARQRGSPVGRAVVSAGTAYLAAELLGRSRFAKKVGRLAGHTLLDAGEKRFQAEVDAWSQRVVFRLEGVSVVRRNLTTSGNSSQVVGKFLATRQAAKPETRVRRGIDCLQRLAASQLVYNTEIPELLKLRQKEALDERRRQAELRMLDLPGSPGIDALRFPHRAALLDYLQAFPEERVMIIGAMDAIVGDSPERIRHSAASARSALESAAARATGEPSWHSALPLIRAAAPDEVGKLFVNTHRLLSSLTHPGRRGSEALAELAVKNTLNLLVWLIQQTQAVRLVAKEVKHGKENGQRSQRRNQGPNADLQQPNQVVGEDRR